MFEARLVEGNTFKSIIEAIKDLVTDGYVRMEQANLKHISNNIIQ